MFQKRIQGPTTSKMERAQSSFHLKCNRVPESVFAFFISFVLLLRKASIYLLFFYRSGTILKKYFGWRSPMRESELPMQLGCTGICEPLGRVRMHNPGRVHQKSAGNHNILNCFQGLIMEIPGLLRRFIIIYKEFKFFFHTNIYKSLILVAKTTWSPNR